MAPRTLFFLLFAITLSACNKDKIFEKHHKFDNNTWVKPDAVTFETTIEDISEEYDIYLALRHTSVYSFANVVIGFTINTPAGEKRMMPFSLIIRNTDGSFKGKGLGDIWDIEVPLYKNMLFKHSGLYKFTIENRMHLIEMPEIMSVGLVIKKSSKQEKL